MTVAQKIRTIDTHTHILADATIKLLQKEIPKLGLKLTPYDDENSVIEVAGVPYRPFPRGGHDIERRFADMDATGIDRQIISLTSPGVQVFDAATGTSLARDANDELAAAVRATPQFTTMRSTTSGNNAAQ